MQKTGYTSHTFSLFLLLVLGNAILNLPFNSLFSLLLATVLSLTLIALTLFVLKRYKSSKVLFYTVSVVILLLAVYNTIICFYDYVCFLSKEQLPDTSISLLVLALLVVITFCSVSRSDAFLKYCLLAAAIGIVLIFINFLAGIKNFDFALANTLFSKPYFSLKDILHFFSALLVAVFFIFTSKKQTTARPVFWGMLSGFFILTLCFTQSVLTLGNISDISFPYLKAVSVISSGSLFTRLDGFVYFLFFVSALIKISIGLKVVVITLRSLFTTKAPLLK